MPRVCCHPGEILREEFLVSLALSGSQLARDIDVPESRIRDILRERKSVSADTAIRLGKYFGIEPLFWLNLQQAHDLSKAQAENDYSDVAKGPA